MYSCISESTTDVPRHDQTLNYRPEAFGAVAPDQYDAGCPRAPPHSAPVAIGTHPQLALGPTARFVTLNWVCAEFCRGVRTRLLVNRR